MTGVPYSDASARPSLALMLMVPLVRKNYSRTGVARPSKCNIFNNDVFYNQDRQFGCFAQMRGL